MVMCRTRSGEFSIELADAESLTFVCILRVVQTSINKWSPTRGQARHAILVILYRRITASKSLRRVIFTSVRLTQRQPISKSQKQRKEKSKHCIRTCVLVKLRPRKWIRAWEWERRTWAHWFAGHLLNPSCTEWCQTSTEQKHRLARHTQGVSGLWTSW